MRDIPQLNRKNRNAEKTLLKGRVPGLNPRNSGVGGTADWFEVTNYGLSDVFITGWKMDDASFLSGASVALNGVASISSGQSVMFLESAAAETDISTFRTFWGSNVTSINIGSMRDQVLALAPLVME
jgi:hypothetical protein